MDSQSVIRMCRAEGPGWGRWTPTERTDVGKNPHRFCTVSKFGHSPAQSVNKNRKSMASGYSPLIGPIANKTEAKDTRRSTWHRPRWLVSLLLVVREARGEAARSAALWSARLSARLSAVPWDTVAQNPITRPFCRWVISLVTLAKRPPLVGEAGADPQESLHFTVTHAFRCQAVRFERTDQLLRNHKW